jgi:hypothetical protein
MRGATTPDTFDVCAGTGAFFVVADTSNGAHPLLLFGITNTGGTQFNTITLEAVTAQYYPKVLINSDGNIVVAANRTNGSPNSMVFGVYTQQGAVKVAFQQTIVGGNTSAAIELTVGSGFFAMGGTNNTTQETFQIFDNNGNLKLNVSFGGATANMCRKIVDDGANFYFCFILNTTTVQIAKYSYTGTLGFNNTFTVTAMSGTSIYLDGYYRSAVNLLVSTNAAVAPVQLSVKSNGIQYKSFTWPNTTANENSGMIEVSDFVYLRTWQGTAASDKLNFALYKWMDVSIIGVAASSGAANSTVSFNTVGTFTCNTINGTSPLQFDHSSANLHGNKGSMFTLGCTLSGM